MGDAGYKQVGDQTGRSARLENATALLVELDARNSFLWRDEGRSAARYLRG